MCCDYIGVTCGKQRKYEGQVHIPKYLGMFAKELVASILGIPVQSSYFICGLWKTKHKADVAALRTFAISRKHLLGITVLQKRGM